MRKYFLVPLVDLEFSYTFKTQSQKKNSMYCLLWMELPNITVIKIAFLATYLDLGSQSYKLIGHTC